MSPQKDAISQLLSCDVNFLTPEHNLPEIKIDKKPKFKKKNFFKKKKKDLFGKRNSKAPKWAIAIGHEEMWKLHNGCPTKKDKENTSKD